MTETTKLLDAVATYLNQISDHNLSLTDAIAVAQVTTPLAIAAAIREGQGKDK